MGATVTWQELEAAAPQLAARGRLRLELSRVALLGTLRADGSPRISPVEPYFSRGQLLFGAMAWSLKARDLRRDSRCVLHSTVTGADEGEDEFKLYGRALEASAEIRDGCSDGWWQARPRGAADVLVLGIEQVTLIEWNLEESQMIVRRWSPGHRLTEARRSYP